MTTHISVKGLSKSYGRFEAVRNVSFDIGKGRLIGLLGPSGGGKTTILRMLAGLETPDAGDIYFHNKRVNDLPPQKRGIGFVFQNYALFRHMTVFDNVAFGLKVQKKKKAEIRERVLHLLKLTGLAGLESRYPQQLSGGQRQRVAFARALAPEPELLLLDEPFAAIDAKVRKELRTWLKEMINRLGITTIFVTHDQEEAVEVADEIMIIHQGRLEQKGTPYEIYKNPQTPFVVGFIGESNTLDDIAHLKGFHDDHADTKAMIRPEFIEIGFEDEIVHRSAAERGVVRNVYFRGANWQIEVEVGPYRLSAYRPLERRTLNPGDEVLVLIHRMYLVNGEQISVAENVLKREALAIHI